MTYMAYKPGAERLRRYLRSLPTSGIDETLYPDIIAIEADKAAAEREKALSEAKTATLNAAQSVGELAAGDRTSSWISRGRGAPSGWGHCQERTGRGGWNPWLPRIARQSKQGR